MSYLYFLPFSHLILLVMVLCLALSGQLICLGLGFFEFRHRKKHILRAMLEALILVQQLLLLICAAETIYHTHDGFIVLICHDAPRILLFAVILLSGVTVCFVEKSPLALSAALLCALTVPAAEAYSGSAFPLLFETAAVLWLLRVMGRSYISCRILGKNLSVLSIKEAIDTMDFGILFCRTRKNADGQILLCNNKMQFLIQALMGRQIYNNGKYFYDCLLSGDVLPECRQEALEAQPVYTLPDGSVWRFRLQYLYIGRHTYTMLLASDMTRQKEINDQLYSRNRELEQRNQELKTMLQNIASISRTEEILHAKRQVHNVLGQQISLLLRSVREHREPDQELLRSVAEGLPRGLQAADAGFSLKNLVKNFEALGITVRIEGTLPPRPELQRAFYEIITESMTNAVHHGYATEITITMGCIDSSWTLDITNNGLSKEDTVLEGGGLTGIRQKVSELGGSFCYRQTPGFTVSVTVPKEEPI